MPRSWWWIVSRTTATMTADTSTQLWGSHPSRGRGDGVCGAVARKKGSAAPARRRVCRRRRTPSRRWPRSMPAPPVAVGGGTRHGAMGRRCRAAVFGLNGRWSRAGRDAVRDAEPGGRLPVTILRRQSDLPQVDWDASTRPMTAVGPAKLDRDGVAAAYPPGSVWPHHLRHDRTRRRAA